MNILVDSSTMYSAIGHSGKVSMLLDLIIEKHTIVLSDYIIEELRRNFSEKLSGKARNNALSRLDEFISFFIVKKKEEYIGNLRSAIKLISKKDAPVLACGMLTDIDYLLSSDKEFSSVVTDRVIILTPKEAEKVLLDR